MVYLNENSYAARDEGDTSGILGVNQPDDKEDGIGTFSGGPG